MYTPDTITNVAVFSANMNIKIGDTVCNVIIALARGGRNMFSAQDIAYIINRNVKAERNKVTDVQVKSALLAEVRANARGNRRRGMRNITSIDGYFFQHGA